MRRTVQLGDRTITRRAARAGAAAVLAILAVGSTTAHADRRNLLEGQPPIRHRVELRASRFEITPQLVVSLNQDFKHFVGGGVVLQYHILDWLAIGAQFAGGIGVDTGLTDRLAGPNGTLPD